MSVMAVHDSVHVAIRQETIPRVWLIDFFEQKEAKAAKKRSKQRDLSTSLLSLLPSV
jgi:hypothetical protein